MINWRDDLLDIARRSSKWVDDNLDKIFFQEKSTIEYYQMRLFDKKNLNLSDLQKLLEIYNPLDVEKSEKIYFRQIEQLSLGELAGKNQINEIRKLFEQGFFYKLVNGKISLDILSNRDYLYIITHDIFYSSIFGRDNRVMQSVYNNKNILSLIFVNSLLIAMRHYDTDVLMELLCCIYILDIIENIPEYVLQIIVTFLKRYQLPDGSIPSDVGIEHPTFTDVYHTCLVASILYYCMEDS